jgi:hypothetical protein
MTAAMTAATQTANMLVCEQVKFDELSHHAKIQLEYAV